MINKFKETLQGENVSVKEFCDKIGLKHGSFRNMIRGNVPKWIKSFNFGYKLGSKVKEIEVIEPIEISFCEKCKLEIHPMMGMICKDPECPGLKD
jgi:hypothetical protein